MGVRYAISEMKVSVCLPSYNYAYFLGEAIASVLAQTYGDFELIIVDDASTDGSEEVIHGFSDRRVRFFRNEVNSGAIRTWNRCLSLVRGEYICFLCADDLFLPRKLEAQTVLLDRYPDACLAHSDGFSIDAAGERESLFRSRFPGELQSYLAMSHINPGREEFKRLLAGYNYIHLSSAMFRRRCWQEAGNFDERFPYAADWDFWLRLVLLGDVAYMPESLFCVRWHGENLTAEMKRSGQAYADWYGVVRAAGKLWPGPQEEIAPARREALQVIRDHILPDIHEDYAKGRMAQARRKIRLAFRNDPSLLRHWPTLYAYFKSFLGKR